MRPVTTPSVDGNSVKGWWASIWSPTAHLSKLGSVWKTAAHSALERGDWPWHIVWDVWAAVGNFRADWAALAPFWAFLWHVTLTPTRIFRLSSAEEHEDVSRAWIFQRRRSPQKPSILYHQGYICRLWLALLLLLCMHYLSCYWLDAHKKLHQHAATSSWARGACSPNLDD